MTTPTDLNRVFASLEADADEHLDAVQPSWIRTGAPSTRRRPRVLAPLVAAAAVVVAVAGSYSLTRPSSHERPRESTAAPRTTGTAPRYRTMPLHELVFHVPARTGSPTETYARAAYQTVGLDTPGRLGQVFVTFHRAGAKAPYAADGSTPVEVNGRPGVYAVTDTLTHGAADLFRGVAWRYGPDEWATVWSQHHDLNRVGALAIARSVALGRHPLRTPLRIRLTGATERDWAASYPGTVERIVAGGFVVLRDQGHVAQVSLADLPSGTDDTTTINGRTAYWSDHHTVLDISVGPHTAIQVTANSGGKREALRVALATSLTPTPNRVSSWFDATEALP